MTVVKCNCSDCIHYEHGLCDLETLEIKSRQCTKFRLMDEEFYEEDWEEV